MWIGEKFQSNPEIAGSPRNQTANAIEMMNRSQTARDKLGSQKGKSPDLQLRSQSMCSVEKDVRFQRQLGCWLRSSHTFKECVIAH